MRNAMLYNQQPAISQSACAIFASSRDHYFRLLQCTGRILYACHVGPDPHYQAYRSGMPLADPDPQMPDTLQA